MLYDIEDMYICMMLLLLSLHLFSLVTMPSPLTEVYGYEGIFGYLETIYRYRPTYCGTLPYSHLTSKVTYYGHAC